MIHQTEKREKGRNYWEPAVLAEFEAEEVLDFSASILRGRDGRSKVITAEDEVRAGITGNVKGTKSGKRGLRGREDGSARREFCVRKRSETSGWSMLMSEVCGVLGETEDIGCRPICRLMRAIH
ncbi:hypothetical protein RCL_jg12489.t1 [Rhizophagus clarus]|uniref:Uncharacterized protein n=1 Tax=Rhizophagus clarus TaxID=94130 RepID=A0A8H3KX98_9GLOM|nr:hypothetical protein RCL_jg12489.t1 [Rhizophagus clarus]